MIARVRATEEQSPGTAFLPIHWNDQFAALGRVNALAHSAVDPLSGQPEFKSIPITLVPLARDWEAVVLLRERPKGAVDAPYWALAAGALHWRVFAVGAGEVAAALDRLMRLLPFGEMLSYRDAGAKRFRLAVVDDGALQAWLDIRSSSAPLVAEPSGSGRCSRGRS